MVKAPAQFALHEDRPGHRGGKARGVIAERVLDLRQHFRRASGGVDALHLGRDHRGRYLQAIRFPENCFLVLVLTNDLLQQRSRHRLLKRRLCPHPMRVIDAFNGRAIRAARREVVSPDGIKRGRTEQHAKNVRDQFHNSMSLSLCILLSNFLPGLMVARRPGRGRSVRGRRGQARGR
jgi:hypothetical protein